MLVKGAASQGRNGASVMERRKIGGLSVSVLLTVFIVPAAYLLVYGRNPRPVTPVEPDAEVAA